MMTRQGAESVAQPKVDLTTVPIYFSMVVWGSSFTEFFLEFCLPSLVADRNIPSIRRRAGSKFVLHTSAADWATIEKSAQYRLLKEVILVELHLIDDLFGEPHTILSRCHKETMALADSDAVPAVFLSPDTIWSNGSIERVDQLLTAGKRVVFLWSFRLLKEEAEPFIRQTYETGAKTVWDVNARELNGLAFRFLHPTIEEYFFEPGRGEKLSVSVLLWPGPNGDVLAHAFHQHPLLVYPRNRFANFAQTIDGDLVKAACPDPADHYIVQDSDEITAIELSKRSHFLPGVFEKGDSNKVAAWALNGANSVHWTLVPFPVRMHAHAVDEKEWEAVEARAAKTIEGLLAYRRRKIVTRSFTRGTEILLFKTKGMSAPDAQEWMFRRRHAVYQFTRLWVHRGKRLPAFSVLLCGRATRRYFPRLHQLLSPVVNRLRKAGIF